MEEHGLKQSYEEYTMNFSKSDSLKRTEKICSVCHTGIKEGEEYNHNSKVLCEDCSINVRMSRVRKTHWQYIGSIKTEYLIPRK